MNVITLLIKLAGAAYYAHKSKNAFGLDEIKKLIQDVPKAEKSVVERDLEVDAALRNMITWICEQPVSDPIIDSMLATQKYEINRIDPDSVELIDTIFSEKDPYRFKRITAQNVTEVKQALYAMEANSKLKTIVTPMLYGGDCDVDNWLQLGRLCDKMIGSMDGNAAVIESISTKQSHEIGELISKIDNRLNKDNHLKTAFKGLNDSLAPIYGLKRGAFWMVNAVTNGGKSFFLSHLAMGIAIANKPVLMDNTKIPTIYFCCSEDHMGDFFKKIYETSYAMRHGVHPSATTMTKEEIQEAAKNEIRHIFQDNGWELVFHKVNPSEDSFEELKSRVRKLEMAGHEIIVGMYDYIGMMSHKGCEGGTTTEKLQWLYRNLRDFFYRRNTLFVTPHQLNKSAKEMLQGMTDEEQLKFVSSVAGMSMTDGSTKLTNEVDGELAVHLARLKNGEEYFTWCIGKVRGTKKAPPSQCYGAMRIDTNKNGRIGLGLLPDIHLEHGNYTRDVYATSTPELDELLGDEEF